MTDIINPFPYFPDAGTNGYIYIGEANQDARTNPITVYRDLGLTLPWAQPIRTVDGYPAYQGAKSGIYTNASTVSLTVLDDKGRVVTNTVGAAANVSAADLAETGASLIGFLQSGAGAVAETVQTTLRRAIYAGQFGVTANGVTDDTLALQAAVNRAAGGTLILPPGTMLATRITVPSNTRIIGAGKGHTILKIKDASNQPLLVNADTALGNTGIVLEGFTIDGNYLKQTVSANGILWDKVTYSRMDNVEVKDCYGMGITVSAGGHNVFGAGMYVHGNGKTVAGYGLYCFCSSDNQFIGGEYDDNCIGLAIEASGGVLHSRRNSVTGVKARLNRADFSQSGAGIHFEASAGSDCANSSATGCVVTGNTGVGFNNTSTHGLTLAGNTISGNGFPGISTTGADDILYVGNTITNNGGLGTAGAANRSDVIFGTASSGVVAMNRIGGSGADGSIRTTSATNAVRFVDNDITNATNPYILSGSGDLLTEEKRGSFTATMTGGAGGITATVDWRKTGDEVILDFKTGLTGASNTGTACGFTGAPNELYPAVKQLVPVLVLDNDVVQLGTASIATNAVGTLFVGGSGVFNGAGNKGIPAGAKIRYRLR